MAVPFREAGIQLDPSQIPPTLGERAQAAKSAVGETVQEKWEAVVTKPAGKIAEAAVKGAGALGERKDKIVEGGRARAEEARSGIASWVGEKALKIKTDWTQLREGVAQFNESSSTRIQETAGSVRSGAADKSAGLMGSLRGAVDRFRGGVAVVNEAAENKAASTLKPAKDLIASAWEAKDRASQAAVASVQKAYEGTRTKAAEKLGPFVEKVQKDKETIRSNAAAANEVVAQTVAKDKSLAGEFIVAQWQRAGDMAGAAVDLPGRGLDLLRHAGGAAGDQFMQRVGGPVAKDFEETRERWTGRAQRATSRLDRVFQVYGDAAAPLLNPVVDAARTVAGGVGTVFGKANEVRTGFTDSVAAFNTWVETQTPQTLHAAGELIRKGKEHGGRVYEAMSDWVVSNAVEAWSKVPGLPDMDIKARVGLLRARFANLQAGVAGINARAASISVPKPDLSGAAKYAGAKLEDAAALGIAGASLAAEGAAKLATTKEGRILAGGLVAGGLTVLAVTHPDVFRDLSQMLGQFNQAGAASGLEGVSQVIPQAAADIPGNIARAIPTSPDAIQGALGSVPIGEGVSGVAEAFAQAPTFADFLNQQTSVDTTLWDAIKSSVSPFGEWTSASGVTKGDVVADIIRKFMLQAGQQPDLMHPPGVQFSLQAINLSAEQLQVIQDALNTTSVEQYQTEIMPRFEALINRG